MVMRVLVVGGYGGFGGRLSIRLADMGYEVIVAGRSLEKAAAFCRSRRGCTPALFDREKARVILSTFDADVVVDAAGPFQATDYGLVEACISSGVHYLDIADARQFVSGIVAFDADAQTAGVAVISGASSVPALSGAAVREAMAGMDEACSIDIAISASNRATAGPSVSRAILSYAGKPLRMWRGKRWHKERGWSHLVRRRLSLQDGRTIGLRWMAIADVPDLELLPRRIAGQPRVDFIAGTDLAHQTIGLWLASKLVHMGLLVSLESLAGVVGYFQKLARPFGSDLSAMQLRLAGKRGGDPVEKVWTLIAGSGDGPEIPTLAAVALVEKMARMDVRAGARDAGEELTLADFEFFFRQLDVGWDWRERVLQPPLYARIIGERFHSLPDAVRAMHDIVCDAGAQGEAYVMRGRNRLAHIIAWIMRFPRAGHHQLHVDFEERDGVERWTRDFGGRRFSSTLSQSGEFLIERFGPMRFRFSLPVEHNGLAMKMQGWTFFGVPLPRCLAPRSQAREWEEKGRFHFDVPISLPLIGLVVHYRGWLQKE